MSQKKAGVILSYVNTVITSLMNILFVPLFISHLGAAEYGVYKIINSFAGYLLIMDFGIGTIVTRYVSLYNSKGDIRQRNRCVATSVIVSMMLVTIVMIIGLTLKTQINNIYKNSMTTEQLALAHDLYLMMIINIALSMICHLFSGYVNAYERFIVSNALATGRLMLRIIIILALLFTGHTARLIIATDLFLTAALLIIYMLYCFTKLDMKINLKQFDKSLLVGYFMFSGAVLLQSVVNQVNNSVDNMILGVMSSPEVVTMYSSGMTIYGLYVALPQTVANVFLPQATRLFGEKLPDDDGTKLTDFVVRPGRYEAMICMAILIGFTLLGKDFIALWIGNEYSDAWMVALLLMVPFTIPLCENVMITILNAQNKRMFRSVVLFGVAGLNVLLTVFLVGRVGFIGAAIGTCVSVILGHGIVINIYYVKKFKLRLWYMCKALFKGILPCAIAVFVLCIPLYFWETSGWIGLAAKASVFGILYAGILYRFGLNTEEKSVVGVLLSFFKR